MISYLFMALAILILVLTFLYLVSSILFDVRDAREMRYIEEQLTAYRQSVVRYQDKTIEQSAEMWLPYVTDAEREQFLQRAREWQEIQGRDLR